MEVNDYRNLGLFVDLLGSIKELLKLKICYEHQESRKLSGRCYFLKLKQNQYSYLEDYLHLN